MPTAIDDLDRGLDVLAALADPQRAEILMALAEGPRCTCDFVGPLSLSQPTVSHHLKQLRVHGLIVGERRGRFTYYRIVPEALERLAGHLNELAQRARENHT